MGLKRHKLVTVINIPLTLGLDLESSVLLSQLPVQEEKIEEDLVNQYAP